MGWVCSGPEDRKGDVGAVLVAGEARAPRAQRPEGEGTRRAATQDSGSYLRAGRTLQEKTLSAPSSPDAGETLQGPVFLLLEKWPRPTSAPLVISERWTLGTATPSLLPPGVNSLWSWGWMRGEKRPFPGRGGPLPGSLTRKGPR